MIAREIRAVCRQQQLHHLVFRGLPAEWHFHPELIAEGVRSEVLRARDEGASRVFIAYADCGTGGALDRVCDDLGVERVPGPHCFAFYQGTEHPLPDDTTSFYVTDFLARQPYAFLWKPLGLDRHPELRDTYFAAYEKVVYLSQTKDDDLLASAKGIAERLRLVFEHRHTGYGDLERVLPRWDRVAANERETA